MRKSFLQNETSLIEDISFLARILQIIESRVSGEMTGFGGYRTNSGQKEGDMQLAQVEREVDWIVGLRLRSRCSLRRVTVSVMA